MKAQWPDSGHITPTAIKAGDDRLTIAGRAPRFDCRVLSEDEYQLLLGGFLAAGGKLEQPQ